MLMSPSFHLWLFVSLTTLTLIKENSKFQSILRSRTVLHCRRPELNFRCDKKKRRVDTQKFKRGLLLESADDVYIVNVHLLHLFSHQKAISVPVAVDWQARVRRRQYAIGFGRGGISSATKHLAPNSLSFALEYLKASTFNHDDCGETARTYLHDHHGPGKPRASCSQRRNSDDRFFVHCAFF